MAENFTPILPRTESSTIVSTSSSSSPPKSKRRIRKNHACENCRRKRTKCTMQRPTCTACLANNIECVYGERRKGDDVARELEILRERSKRFEKLLFELIPQLNTASKEEVVRMLQQSSIDPQVEDLATGLGRADGLESQPETSDSDDEAELGSLSSQDRVKGDINTDSVIEPIGFMGKSSDTSLIDRIKDELRNERMTSATAIKAATSLTDGSPMQGMQPSEHDHEKTYMYHMDDLDFNLPNVTDYLEIPEKPVSDALVNFYFETVHPLCPLLQKAHFLERCSELYEHRRPDMVEKKWLAMYNIVIAIGQTYHDLLYGHRPAPVDLAFSRARILAALDGGLIFQIADLQQVQLVLLGVIYLTAKNQMNRAWSMTGLAVAQSQSLGLHLINTSPDLTDTQKELRYQVFHSVQYLEATLSCITGRPSSIRIADCSALNRDIRVEHHDLEGELDRYFLARGKLLDISADILRNLYSPRSTAIATSKLRYLEKTMLGLANRLKDWKKTLCDSELDFDTENPLTSFQAGKVLRQKFDLALRYYHLKLLLYRPCVCNNESRLPDTLTKEFVHQSALACIKATHCILSITVQANDSSNWVISVSPWWCLMTPVISATAILMLELVNECNVPDYASRDDRHKLFEAARTTVSWLDRLGRDNPGINRCYTELKTLLRQIAVRLEIDQAGHEAQEDQRIDLDQSWGLFVM